MEGQVHLAELENAFKHQLGRDLPAGLKARLRTSRGLLASGSLRASPEKFSESARLLAALDPERPETVNAAFEALNAVVGATSATEIDPVFRVGGWVRDLPDPRDQMYSAPLAVLKSLPSSVDLRAHLPPPYDQGRIGSCSANAVAAAVQFARRHAGQAPDFSPSRLFIYYFERAIENRVLLDSGASLRDGMKSIAKQGACAEATWPYDDTPADQSTHLFPNGSPAVQAPSATAMGEARTHVAISYWSLAQSPSQLKSCLAEGFPFVFGFLIYRSFFDAAGAPRATVPIPSQSEDFIGAHAVTAVGYDDASATFLIRNSWGPNRQDHGHFHMPYAYLIDSQLAADFWTVRALTG